MIRFTRLNSYQTVLDESNVNDKKHILVNVCVDSESVWMLTHTYIRTRHGLIPLPMAFAMIMILSFDPIVRKLVSS